MYTIRGMIGNVRRLARKVLNSASSSPSSTFRRRPCNGEPRTIALGTSTGPHGGQRPQAEVILGAMSKRILAHSRIGPETRRSVSVRHLSVHTGAYIRFPSVHAAEFHGNVENSHHRYHRCHLDLSVYIIRRFPRDLGGN